MMGDILPVLSSMTGYGRASKQSKTLYIQIDIRSLNSKYLEIRSKVPKNFQSWEQNIRAIVTQYLERGSLEITLITKSEDQKIKQLLSGKKLEELSSAIEEKAKHLKIPSGLNLVSLMCLPDLRDWEDSSYITMQEEETIYKDFDSILHSALENLVKMRRNEGERILEVLKRELNIIEFNKKKVSERLPEIKNFLFQKLKQRIELLLKETNVVVDPTRILQEAAFQVDKSDITEELDRLGSHICEFHELLKGNKKTLAVGKHLDFIVQEMQRETNTMNVKSASVEFTPIFLEIKLSLERIREQVQNVE